MCNNSSCQAVLNKHINKHERALNIELWCSFYNSTYLLWFCIEVFILRSILLTVRCPRCIVYWTQKENIFALKLVTKNKIQIWFDFSRHGYYWDVKKIYCLFLPIKDVHQASFFLAFNSSASQPCSQKR